LSATCGRTVRRGVRPGSGRGGRLDQRISQHSAESDMNDPPLGFAGHGIGVAPAQEPNIAGGFQIVHVLRIGPVLAIEKLDRALVLQTAVDQQLFARALRFKRDARHLHVECDSDDGAHQEDQ
jgi:hypothetical protein